MYAKDFVFNGKKLSDYGCVLCSLTESTDIKTISIGSNITFNTIYTQANNKFKLMSSDYTEAYSATFQICKLNCSDINDKFFSVEETASITRWLNQKSYKRFQLITDDGQYDNIYYMGSFNLQKILLGNDTVGFELTLQTDAPFGYYNEVYYELTFNTSEDTNIVYDPSDEIGYIYPKDIVIECLSSGNLEIENSQEPNRKTIINNCMPGEIISIDSENKIITSNKAHPRLYNDFNYNYMRISNRDKGRYDDTLNEYSVSMPCRITFSYSPICKVGLV